MVHMSVDNDERMEKTCSKCKNSLENEKCISCGDRLVKKEDINPNFDESLFKKLKSQAT